MQIFAVLYGWAASTIAKKLYSFLAHFMLFYTRRCLSGEAFRPPTLTRCQNNGGLWKPTNGLLLLYNGISYLGPQNWGFLPLKSPQMLKYQQDPQKALPYMGLHVLALDEAIASRALFVIVSGSNGRGDGQTVGRKRFWGQLNNSKLWEMDHISQWGN